MVKPTSIPNEESFIRLWVHEICRIFGDRLCTPDDDRWFKKAVVELLNRYFKPGLTANDFFGEGKVVFSDFMKLEASTVLYEEVKDKLKLLRLLENKLDDYNMNASSKMNLVFFEEAIDHVIRIARVLRQKRGHAMLIGKKNKHKI